MSRRLAVDRGSATVAVVGALVALTLLLTAVVAHVSTADSAARARASADLAALAAATHARDTWALGQGRTPARTRQACARAEAIALAHRTDLVACSVRGMVVSVTVQASSGGGIAGQLTVKRTSRAGPTG